MPLAYQSRSSLLAALLLCLIIRMLSPPVVFLAHASSRYAPCFHAVCAAPAMLRAIRCARCRQQMPPRQRHADALMLTL